MGQLFDKMTAGLPPNPNRGANWMAVGSGLSQLAQGGPVDLSQHYERIQQNKGMTGAIEGLKEELGPERYKALLNAPPAIQKAIVSKWYEQQFSGPSQTDTMRNLEWRAQQAGLQPGSQEWKAFMLSGGTSGGKMSAAEEKLLRIQETVNPATGRKFTRDEALTLTEHLSDPLPTGEIIDLRTGHLWQGFEPPQTVQPEMQPSLVNDEITQTPLPPSMEELNASGIGVEGDNLGKGNPNLAIGPVGTLIQMVNAGLDMAHLPIASKEALVAKTAMEKLANVTVLELSDWVSGKPSNLTLEMLQDMTLKPNRLFQGKNIARTDLAAVMDLLQQAIDVHSAVARSTEPGFTGEQRSKARLKLQSLIPLMEDYQQLHDAFGKGAESNAPSPTSAEEYNALPSGTKYQHPDDPPGTLRTKQ